MFAEIGKLSLKSMEKCQKPRIHKTTLKKTKGQSLERHTTWP
jgi:hypothetical protein